jgi:hypothetical protein
MPTAGPEATRFLSQYSVLMQLYSYIVLSASQTLVAIFWPDSFAVEINVDCSTELEWHLTTLSSNIVTVAEEGQVMVMCESLLKKARLLRIHGISSTYRVI